MERPNHAWNLGSMFSVQISPPYYNAQTPDRLNTSPFVTTTSQDTQSPILALISSTLDASWATSASRSICCNQHSWDPLVEAFFGPLARTNKRSTSGPSTGPLRCGGVFVIILMASSPMIRSNFWRFAANTIRCENQHPELYGNI